MVGSIWRIEVIRAAALSSWEGGGEVPPDFGRADRWEERRAGMVGTRFTVRPVRFTSTLELNSAQALFGPFWKQEKENGCFRRGPFEIPGCSDRTFSGTWFGRFLISRRQGR